LKKINVTAIILTLLFAFSSNVFSQNSDNLLTNTVTLKNTKSTEMDKSLIKSHFKTESAPSLADFPKSLRVQPAVTVHVTGGYSLPMDDLRGKILEFSRDSSGGRFPNGQIQGLSRLFEPGESTMGMKGGFNVGADVHIAFGKTGPGQRRFRVVIGGAYTNMGHSQGKDHDPYRYVDSLGNVDSTDTKVELNLNKVTVGLGVEWAFRPWETFNPFVGLDLTGNFYSGEAKLEPPPTTVTAGYSTQTLKSESRFGFAVGFGADYAFSKNIGAILGVKYHWPNLIGTSYDAANTTATQYAIDDKSHTVNGVEVSSKRLSEIQFYGGLSFYFGQPPRKTSK
jgi:opacity protein-like surface antigen